MKRATTRHRWKFKGICADAIQLGVGREHLFKVLTGNRPGKSLTERYHALKATQAAGKFINSPKPPKPTKPVHHNLDLAAADNLSPYFFATLSKLGLQVVITRFNCAGKPELFRPAYCEKELEAALQAADAGYHDSTCYNEENIWHFFHTSKLATAMTILKAAITARGLLPHVTILHSEESNQFRVWYPPTAELING